MPALPCSQLPGHDILRARHGNHISTMRVDHGAGKVAALPDDGSTDSAPTVISAGLPVPGSITTGVLLEDWKFSAASSGCWAAFIGLMVAATAIFSSLSGAGPAQLPGSYPGN